MTRDISEFRVLVDTLRERSRLIASPSRRFTLPEYRALIEMGPTIIPMLLAEIRDGRISFMCPALSELTGVALDLRAGDLRQQGEAWLDWAAEHGIDF